MLYCYLLKFTSTIVRVFGSTYKSATDPSRRFASIRAPARCSVCHGCRSCGRAWKSAEPPSSWQPSWRGRRPPGSPNPHPNVARPVRLSAMVEVEADIRRLLRGPRHQRIVDDQIPDRRREMGDEDLAEALRDGNPGPLYPFEPFEIGGPLSARRDGEKGLSDEAPVRDHGTDE